MSQTIDFFADLVSPNFYLANQVLPEIATRHDATIRYIPCLLGGIMKATNNQPPFVTFANVKGKLEYGRIELQRYIKKHGIDRFRMNPHFPLNSLLMMRGALVAERDGRLAEYIAIGERLMWEEGLKLDDPAVFAEAWSKHGFDGAALLEGTQDPEIKGKLIENTNLAVERGVFGIPTMFVGDEMFFGKDSLGDLEDELHARN